MDPETTKLVAQLFKDHAWLSLAIVTIPILDNLIAEGKWPFGLSTSPKYRIFLIFLGSSIVSVLSAVQEGSSWTMASVCGLVVFALALLKNGETLFGPKIGKPDAVEHVPGGELPQPSGAELPKTKEDR